MTRVRPLVSPIEVILISPNALAALALIEVVVLPLLRRRSSESIGGRLPTWRLITRKRAMNGGLVGGERI
jgi:hypothetical protein